MVALAGCSSSLPAFNDAVGQISPPGTEKPLVGIVSGSRPALSAPGVAPTLPTRPTIPGFTIPNRTVPPGAGTPTAFCTDVASLQTLITSLLSSVVNPADLNRARALLAKLTADAPPEMRAPLQTLVQLQDRVGRDLASKPPNSTDIISVFTDPGYQSSLQQLLGYSLTHCSINLTPPTT